MLKSYCKWPEQGLSSDLPGTKSIFVYTDISVTLNSSCFASSSVVNNEGLQILLREEVTYGSQQLIRPCC